VLDVVFDKFKIIWRNHFMNPIQQPSITIPQSIKRVRFEVIPVGAYESGSHDLTKMGLQCARDAGEDLSSKLRSESAKVFCPERPSYCLTYTAVYTSNFLAHLNGDKPYNSVRLMDEVPSASAETGGGENMLVLLKSLFEVSHGASTFSLLQAILGDEGNPCLTQLLPLAVITVNLEDGSVTVVEESDRR
jgi:hypothetical protein